MGGCGCLAYTNVLEDRGDDIRIFDAGDDAQRATALGAGLDVDGEDAFQALHPGHGGKGLIRLFLAGFAFWHDGLAMLAIRCEHAVEPGEVQSRTRDQRRQAGDEVEWVEDDVGGAVAKRLLEPMDDFVPDRWSRAARWRWRAVRCGDRAFRACRVGWLHGRWRSGAKPPGSLSLCHRRIVWGGFGPYRDGAQGQCLTAGVGPPLAEPDSG